MEMRGLTLTQPWASLMVANLKLNETRSWPTKYRGWLAIHAAKGFPAEAKDFANCKMVSDLLHCSAAELPRGQIIGVGKLIACMETEKFLHPDQDLFMPGKFMNLTEQEELFGNYETNRYGWVFTGLGPLPSPIPVRGALGLWKLAPEVHHEICRQLMPSSFLA